MRSHAIEPLHVVAVRDRLQVGLKVNFWARRPTHRSGQEQPIACNSSRGGLLNSGRFRTSGPTRIR